MCLTMRARGPHIVTLSGAGGLNSRRQNGFTRGFRFVRFVSESRPASRRYPTPLHFGDGIAGRWAAFRKN